MQQLRAAERLELRPAAEPFTRGSQPAPQPKTTCTCSQSRSYASIAIASLCEASAAVYSFEIQSHLFVCANKAHERSPGCADAAAAAGLDLGRKSRPRLIRIASASVHGAASAADGAVSASAWGLAPWVPARCRLPVDLARSPSSSSSFAWSDFDFDCARPASLECGASPVSAWRWHPAPIPSAVRAAPRLDGARRCARARADS